MDVHDDDGHVKMIKTKKMTILNMSWHVHLSLMHMTLLCPFLQYRNGHAYPNSLLSFASGCCHQASAKSHVRELLYYVGRYVRRLITIIVMFTSSCTHCAS